MNASTIPPEDRVHNPDAPHDKSPVKTNEQVKEGIKQEEEIKQEEKSTDLTDHKIGGGGEDDGNYLLEGECDDNERAFSDQDEEEVKEIVKRKESVDGLDSHQSYDGDYNFVDGKSGDSSFELYDLLNTKNEQPLTSE